MDNAQRPRRNASSCTTALCGKVYGMRFNCELYAGAILMRLQSHWRVRSVWNPKDPCFAFLPCESETPKTPIPFLSQVFENTWRSY
jgi:hypothetical protein